MARSPSPNGVNGVGETSPRQQTGETGCRLAECPFRTFHWTSIFLYPILRHEDTPGFATPFPRHTARLHLVFGPDSGSKSNARQTAGAEIAGLPARIT